MKATVYEKPGDVELKEVPKPEIKTANDAIIKVPLIITPVYC